jgi:hypothetical protein
VYLPWGVFEQIFIPGEKRQDNEKRLGFKAFCPMAYTPCFSAFIIYSIIFLRLPYAYIESGSSTSRKLVCREVGSEG